MHESAMNSDYSLQAAGNRGGPASTAPAPYPRPAIEFTRQEWRALRSLHGRYLQGHDIFSARELEHLRFLWWLRDTGRLDP